MIQKVQRFLDGVGQGILWIDLLVQAVSLGIRAILFFIVSKIVPFVGKPDFEWNLRVPRVSGLFFGVFWILAVGILFVTTSVYVFLTILVIDFVITQYGLLNGTGERRREIFFHGLIQGLISLGLIFIFVWGTGLRDWHGVNEYQHHGNAEAIALFAFIVLRSALFPFHTHRLDYGSEISPWLGFAQLFFNFWIIFQVGLFTKTVGFLDSFGDWSGFLMGWMMVSFLYSIALSAMQIRVARIWSHVFWILMHLALYVSLL